MIGGQVDIDSQAVIHFIGIKGTGMSSLARLCSRLGYRITGSDIPDRFYTDEILDRESITVFSGFSARHIPDACSLVISSSVYRERSNVEVNEALRRGIRLLDYSSALAEFSSHMRTIAVAGTHGKSSICSMIEHLMESAPAHTCSVYGSALLKQESSSGKSGPPSILCIEACEYQKHLLGYHPEVAVLSNIAYEHPDVFSSTEELINLFTDFVMQVKPEGTLIYCADDPHAEDVALEIRSQRPDIRLIGYGKRATGPYRTSGVETGAGVTRFKLGSAEFGFHIPGEHMVLNMAAASAAVGAVGFPDLITSDRVSRYPGLIRRSELMGRSSGVTVVDDYAHHPDEISVTIEALQNFYQPKRIILDFVPHTISRTRILFDQFTQALQADLVFIHPVYLSAREQAAGTSAAVKLSRELSDRVEKAVFVESDREAVRRATELLTEGDLFVTMGAGNNRAIGKRVLQALAGVKTDD
jgi:UDP-N-acetylmuramate--alanine ligase